MNIRPPGTDVVMLDAVDSTNDEVRRRVERGETGPLWVAARQQTNGKGRHGRPWQTRVGNLAATGLFTFDGTPAGAAQLSFASALAVADLLDALAPDGAISLKWPNDVLLNGRKVAGILLENFGCGPHGRLIVAIGIGVNLAHHPSGTEVRWPATSVLDETGSAPEFETALSILVTRVQHWMQRSREEGFAAVRGAWLQRAARLGEEIEVHLPKSTLTGRFADLDQDGALVLEGAEGQQRIAAGDVHFPEAV